VGIWQLAYVASEVHENAAWTGFAGSVLQPCVYRVTQEDDHSMNVTITHTRAVAGWDVNVKVSTEGNEAISHVLTKVNEGLEDDQDVHPPAKSWENTLRQKGVYPGENKVVVTVTNGDGDGTDWVSEWA
jgi:hypothetical protein